jgi:hypothetical protein
MMTADTVRAWIMLSVPEHGGGLTAIMWTADGINKAIPERDELSDALGWLLAAGFIERDAAGYSRSRAGNDLLERCGLHTGTIFDVWDKLSAALAAIDIDDFRAEPVGDTDFRLAYARYQQEFLEVYKQLEEQDED